MYRVTLRGTYISQRVVMVFSDLFRGSVHVVHVDIGALLRAHALAPAWEALLGLPLGVHLLHDGVEHLVQLLCLLLKLLELCIGLPLEEPERRITRLRDLLPC